MSIVNISKKIVAACNDIFTPTVVASLLTVVYFDFHILAVLAGVVLLGADMVVHLNEKETQV